MEASASSNLRPSAPSFAELFTPKLVTILREGYGWQHLRADAVRIPVMADSDSD